MNLRCDLKNEAPLQWEKKMSWLEPEGGAAEMEENPDPEEDTDLPGRVHLVGRARSEEDGPEDDLSMSGHADEPAEDHRVETNQDWPVEASATVAGVNTHEPEGSLDLTAAHACGQLKEEARVYREGDEEAAARVYREQDEEAAAPECESNICPEAHSESGGQVEELVLPNTEDHNVCLPPMSKANTSGSDLSVDHGEMTQQFSDANSCNFLTSEAAFTGNVQVVSNIDDAPEAEVADIVFESPVEEDNLNINVTAQSKPLTEASLPLLATTASDNLDVPPTSSDHSLHELCDSQVPECDREAACPTSAVEGAESAVSENGGVSDVLSQDSASTPQLQQAANAESGLLPNAESGLLPNAESGHLPNTESGLLPNAESGHLPNAESGLLPNANMNTVPLPIEPSAHSVDSPALNHLQESPLNHLQESPPGDKQPDTPQCPNPTQAISIPEQRVPASAGPVRPAACNSSNLSSLLSSGHSNLLSSSSSPSPQSSPARVLSQAIEPDQLQRELALALQSDDEDELLHELDAELLSRSRSKSPQPASPLRRKDVSSPSNGLQSTFDIRQLQALNHQLLDQLKIRDDEISRLTSERDAQRRELSQAVSQHNEQEKQTSADDLYLPQIKELEKTIAQQEKDLKLLKEKLSSHDNAAKRTISALQNELKSRVEQVTKMYEECLKEKDMMVVKFAESEAKYMDLRRILERNEAKFKEAIKEKDTMAGALKAAKSDKQKLVVGFETKCLEISNLQKEIEKLKEAVSSSEYRIKWFQNKLKEELDQHKETKGNLEKTSAKLKEAREETEMIRLECQSIVKRYQESEEIKSNSLDKELKIKETELRTQMQEKNDTEEIHQMTKKELDSLKSQHKDIIEEAKTLKDKVHCLEEERQQNHRMIENYQEIMQRQKTENASLRSQITTLSALEDDYKRAQEMIISLDQDMSDLKVTNKDLHKDMESCRERESKLLTLQSELSRTNALLRSENSNFSNKVTLLTSEVDKLNAVVVELESHVRELSDKYEEEKTKRKEEIEKLSASLAERNQECQDLKQKWEDEIDSSKTLKRRHANNIKDLTRQLQQAKRKLESFEGKGDSGSMGSRTNSNGSLNSIDNSQHSTHHPVQEFHVITEQVEVDKQVLIERIVRLQKAHARKNEKLEFLGEHIQQLLEEIKKKNKIIQTYVLREEAGTLSSEDMDANKEKLNAMYKSLLARKGGIMASVYSVHQQDGTMTLDLSLQINRKLQAVLEDTLLKNITLKENLDTLGEEIARLSQENRRLQLHLQELERH
ncbi:coiled-coil domain-containing protein 186-like isoform X3 [Physella acuta]|uniref:coiled-coil domain-containing protein 186-like isoform X3 n=1 Tax=Physella acuta TaxID=109671 RepID=UPI0027DD3468|nr:coiled-coil domain-containing protein 186-like isoform X3 [Physella acuta]